MLTGYIPHGLRRKKRSLRDQGHPFILPVKQVGTGGISPVADLIPPLVDHVVFAALVHQAVDVVHPFRAGTEMVLPPVILQVVDIILVGIELCQQQGAWHIHCNDE
jgi:hypothetical protein